MDWYHALLAHKGATKHVDHSRRLLSPRPHAPERLFGRWIRKPVVETGVQFYADQVAGGSFDDYFDWCTSPKPDLRTAPEAYRSNRAAVICAVEHDANQLQYASEELRSDEELVMMAYAQNPMAARWALGDVREKIKQVHIAQQAQVEHAKQVYKDSTARLQTAMKDLEEQRSSESFARRQRLHDYVERQMQAESVRLKLRGYDPSSSSTGVRYRF